MAWYWPVFLRIAKPLVETGQKLGVPLLDRIAVFLGRDALGHRHQVGELQLPDQVHARQAGDHRVIVFSRGQQAQGVGRGVGENQVVTEPHAEQQIVHDAVAKHDHLLAAQLLEGVYRGVPFRAKMA